MSGCLLTFHRDGRPVARGQFASMMARLRHRGADGEDARLGADVAIGHCHFWTTPEEVGEQQPLHSAEAEVSLVLDGRLDNREELAAALGLDDRLGGQSDARLVLAAFLRWDRACFEHLEGAFAIIVHDARDHRVLCARDSLGERSLVYHLDRNHLLVASEEAAILAHPAVGRELDLESAARFFNFAAPAKDSTYFAGLREIEPAHVLEVTRTSSTYTRYWDLNPQDSLQLRDESEYAERFSELLGRSVRCQLRTSAAAPAVLLSGGLDSASIAALAQHANPGAAMAAVSWTFDELPECDEREWIDPVVDRSSLRAVRLGGDDGFPLAGGIAEWPCSMNMPFSNAFRLLLDRGYEAASKAGSRVVLSGWFGDHLYYGKEQWFADLLTEGRWGTALGQSLRAASLRGEAVQLGLGPGLRYWLRSLPGGDLVSRLRRRRLNAPWLTAAARNLAAATLADPARGRSRRRSSILNGFNILSARDEAAFAHRAGVEHRFPYWSRPLVEFALALPGHLLYRPGSEKHILRMAMKDHLPEKVHQRQGHRVLDSLFLRSMAGRAWSQIRDLLAGRDAIWSRFVSRECLDPILQGNQTPAAAGVDIAVLWQCVSFELWRQAAALKEGSS